MAHDRSRPNTQILARHLAKTGRYRTVVEIEAALLVQGKGDAIRHLDETDLRGELNEICSQAVPNMAARNQA